LPGEAIVGGVLSVTVTVNDADEELFDGSVAVQLIVVTPFGNVEPGPRPVVGEEVQTRFAVPESSVAVTV
jgi:hypothetical protein